MYFLDFKKKYGVSLLPQAYNDVKLGELMFVMPNTRAISVNFGSASHIYNLFRFRHLFQGKNGAKGTWNLN